jgi:hypothetical protein
MAASAGVNSAGVAANVCVSDATRHYRNPIRPGSRPHRRARAITRATIEKNFPAGGRAAIADLP